MGNELLKQTKERILERRDILLRERRDIRSQQSELAMRNRAIDRELADCKAAARVFGITDIEFPPDEREEYMRLRAIENRILHEASAERTKVVGAQRMLPLSNDKPATSVTSAMPRIKDIVLDRLKEAGEAGTKAAAIKRYIEQTYATTIHEKTVGMTLYRLSQSKEKPVRRDGQTWFFVPQEADAKNPGVDAPGPINRDN